VVCTIIAVLPRDRFGRRRLLLIASFAIGLGPVFWLMVSEIFPSCIRSVAVSTVANWAPITTGDTVLLCAAAGRSRSPDLSSCAQSAQGPPERSRENIQDDCVGADSRNEVQ